MANMSDLLSFPKPVQINSQSTILAINGTQQKYLCVFRGEGDPVMPASAHRSLMSQNKHWLVDGRHQKEPRL